MSGVGPLAGLAVSGASTGCGRAPAPAPPRALDPVERQSVLDLLHTRFIDQAPAQVHATLLDEETYLCSPRTMYRVLDAAHEIKERRNQVRRPHYAAPELLATRPNAVWSWDITKLRGPATWTYFYLYVILRHLQSLRGRLDDRAAARVRSSPSVSSPTPAPSTAFTRASSRSMRTAARR